MRTKCYLMVTKSGGIRMTKNTGSVKADEIAVEVDITVPDAVFRRPFPVARIEIPDSPVDTDALVEVTADAVAKSLKLDASEVRESLTTAMENAERSRVG